MHPGSHRPDRGFTILEAMISLTLFLGVLLAVATTYVPTRRLYDRGERKADMQQNARLAVSEMSKQIRMAGYFPENFADPPASPALENGILIAGDGALAVHGDVDGSGSSNAFLYCLDGDLLRRTRAAANVAGAYTCSAGEVLAEGVTDLSFTYYAADGAPVPNPPSAPYQLDDQGVGAVPDLSDTSQRGSIRRVVVRLTMRQRTQEENLVYTLTSDVRLRN